MKIILGLALYYVLILNICGTFGENKLKEGNVKNGPDLKEAIEKFLKDLQSQIPEVFSFADLNFTIPSNEYITGTVNFSSISCIGFKEFNATIIYRSFLPVPKAYVLTLEDIVLNLDYKSDLTIYNSKYFSIFGEGTASISLRNLIFDGNVTISLLPVNASTTADVNLDNVFVNVTGLLDDDNFSTDFGKFLGKCITIIFNENKHAISETLTEVLNFVLQKIVNHHHLSGYNDYNLQDVLHFFQDLFINSTTTLIEK